MKNRFIATVVLAVTAVAVSPVFAADMQDMDNMPGMAKRDATEKISHGVGIVKGMDIRQGSVILAHQPIKELNWSSMTMAFKVDNAALLKDVRVGDQVSFDLKGSGMAPVVTAIRPVKSAR